MTEFQSTHLREVRLLASQGLKNPISFQSTHLREVRLKTSDLIRVR